MSSINNLMLILPLDELALDIIILVYKTKKGGANETQGRHVIGFSNDNRGARNSNNRTGSDYPPKFHTNNYYGHYINAHIPVHRYRAQRRTMAHETMRPKELKW